MFNMANQAKRVSDFLLRELKIDEGFSESKKTTIRTSSQQTSFIIAVQNAMHSGASFNDAVSLIIDWAMIASQPSSMNTISEIRILDLFEYHSVPGVHINKVLQLLDIHPRSSNAICDPALFSESLSSSEVEKIVKFFGAQSSYITGESRYYYHVPRLESAELITRYLSVQTDTYENLQPHETLTIYKNKDWPSIGVIIFLERELHIEGFFRITTNHCLGYSLENSDSILEQNNDVLQSKWIRNRVTSISGDSFNRLLMGDMMVLPS